MEVSTETAAFSLLTAILQNDEPPANVTFTNWPSLNIKLVGEGFHGTLTPSVMRGIIDFQSSIYRSFAAAKYGLPDARKLTEEERSDLEIVVRVEEGSSLLDIDIQALLEKLINNVGARMSPTEIIVLTTILALIWSGTTVLKRFFNDRKEIALKKLDEDGRTNLVNTLVALSREDKEKLRIFSAALNENSRIGAAGGVAQDGQADLLKGLAEADEVVIQGQTISGEAIRHMARNARRKATDISLEGLFMIRRVDTTDPLMTRVKVEDVGDRQIIDANVQDDMLSLRKKRALQDAEWGRHPVRLSITAKMLDDEIKDAVVTEVDQLTEDELASITRTRPTS